MDAFVIRVLFALLFGSMIGLERQLTHHIAGLRTNALVSAGSALFMMVGSSLSEGDGYSRVAAQIITGIGFLGGGVILRDGLHIRGLTTAATLWCAAGVGALSGGGLIRQAATATAIIILTNVVLRPLSQRLGDEGGTEARYRLQLVCAREAENPVRDKIVQAASGNGFEVTASEIDFSNEREVSLRADLKCQSSKSSISKVADALSTLEGVRSFQWQKLE